VRWYFRFQLSLRDVEELLFERGVTVTYETIRCWCEWNERPPPTGEGMQEVAPHSQADGIEVPKLEDHKDLPRQIGVTIMNAQSCNTRSIVAKRSTPCSERSMSARLLTTDSMMGGASRQEVLDLAEYFNRGYSQTRTAHRSSYRRKLH
jgi:hypothetical protein